MIKLYTDAATLGNPGPSAAGILIVTAKQQYQFSVSLSPVDNHVAEFMAVQLGLEKIIALGLTESMLQINVDSKIVCQSLEKQYAKHYQRYVDQIIALEQSYALVLHQWLPDRQNKGAHHLAQQALKKNNR